MAFQSASIPTPIRSEASALKQFKRFLSRYFYLCTSLLMVALMVWAFSHTVDARLLHANPRMPRLLWFHAVLFFAWVILFALQSALVRVHKVGIHRTLGWFGAALAATMVVSGFIVSITMLRFELTVLHQPTAGAFLSILWCDLIIFGACMALAIYFRKRPEYHRRLVYLATCQLMQATFVRFHSIGARSLYFPALDLLIVAGILRDLVVDGRVNKIYRYAFPAMIVLQAAANYIELANPGWWQTATHAILG